MLPPSLAAAPVLLLFFFPCTVDAIPSPHQLLSKIHSRGIAGSLAAQPPSGVQFLQRCGVGGAAGRVGASVCVCGARGSCGVEGGWRRGLELRGGGGNVGVASVGSPGNKRGGEGEALRGGGATVGMNETGDRVPGPTTWGNSSLMWDEDDTTEDEGEGNW